MISGGQSAESQSRSEASRGAVGAEHWSERGQRRIQPGLLNIYKQFITSGRRPARYGQGFCYRFSVPHQYRQDYARYAVCLPPRHVS
ncbi:hypothetical protein D7024_10275 [Desulfofundulus salinus]|uniref:Uncharacterized protein n=1 Tax=Desulfofundulus salinus TaxID=2419843 RepID=A0A494X279_9FIRM|nr:hypothetical protein D7024_10275 [Desulfofundulus salinum]